MNWSYNYYYRNEISCQIKTATRESDGFYCDKFCKKQGNEIFNI